MKKLGFALLGLLVLLIAAVLVGPSFVDWNEHKGRFTAEVRELTGREIAIDGDISLSLLPTPALSAAKVRFANAEGGSVLSWLPSPGQLTHPNIPEAHRVAVIL